MTNYLIRRSVAMLIVLLMMMLTPFMSNRTRFSNGMKTQLESRFVLYVMRMQMNENMDL